MKTKQEQIEQIEKVLKDSVADYKHLKKKGYCYCYAETLIDNGYGDVSEYKEEIQRLKANEFAVVAYCNQTMRDAYKKTLIEIKQAKIDVLNMVKSSAARLSATEVYHIYNLVNELIKEVEGQ